MASVTQAHRAIGVTTPLGEDVLLFRSMEAREELGRLFRFDLDLLSMDPEISIDDIIGQSITVRLEIQEGQTRYFNGIVSEFSQTADSVRYNGYRATVRPWLWLLTRTTDCKIFQEMTAPDIIKQVFRDNGFSDFDDRLSESYRTWVYCVQYRETDFNFVSRLMEQEGIYYFFEHEDGKHTLVLADGFSSHKETQGYEELPYYPPDPDVRRERDHVYDWSFHKSVQPGKYALRDFNFEQPKASMDARSAVAREYAEADHEIYDYPGEYDVVGDGETYAGVRIQELQTGYERAEGVGNARGLATGCLFELTQFPREDQNRQYLILSTSCNLTSDEYAPGEGADQDFTIRLQAADARETFRPPRITPKPFVQGPQTAIVVGKSGEEIWTDKYGRVKLQFHWDRYGESDENSSCWVRVSQSWAGKTWGGIMIPRIGQEVIVEFLEGDPDRPIVTGRVYNGDNMPPYGLPDNQTQSGIKTRSSKGGTGDNFNEIRFEDKKGSEELYIHAEKDQTIMVENNKTETVGNDNTEDIGHDETISVHNNRSKTVDVDQKEMIGKNKTIQVGVNHSESIGSNMTINVGANETETVAINKAETIGAAKELTVGGGYQVTVGAAKNQVIGGAKSESVGKSKDVSVGESYSEQVAKAHSLKAKTVTIDADDQITFKTGKAQISMKKNGDITISGKNIRIKGSGNVVIKGKKILQN